MNDKHSLSGMIERNHEFRRRLEQIHVPGRHDPKLKASADEMEIGQGWRNQ